MARWISHRGYCQEATENTREAFDLAIEKGFTSFETDLRITLDGHIVLSHDRDLKRVAGQAIDVHQSTRVDLEKVRLNKGEKLMFLDELYDRYRDFQWTFDIKDSWAKRTIETLVEWAEVHSRSDWIEGHVKFLVWRREQIWHLRGHFPKAEFYALESDCKKAAFGMVFRIPFLNRVDSRLTYGLPPRFMGLELFQKKYVDRYHARAAKILAYLPETEADLRAAEAAGFDEILSDSAPKELKSVSRARSQP